MYSGVALASQELAGEHGRGVVDGPVSWTLVLLDFPVTLAADTLALPVEFLLWMLYG